MIDLLTDCLCLQGHGTVETERVPRKVATLGSVEQVSCGKAHSAVLLRSGKLLTFGNGGNGRLGHGDEEAYLTPKPVAGNLSGKICIEVSCGGLHTAVVTQDAHVYSFGDGHDGQLGLGSERQTDSFVPARVEMPDFESKPTAGDAKAAAK